MLIEQSPFSQQIWIPPCIWSESGFSSGFLPSDLSSLKIWLKADAIAGLNDGDGIVSWLNSFADASGDFSQSNSSKRLVYKTGIKNGLPVVRGDGAQKWLETASGYTGLNAKAGTTFFYVVKFNATGGSNNNLFTCSDESQNVASSQQETNLWFETPTTSSSNYGSHAFTSTSWQIRSVVFDGSQTGNTNRLKVWLNGSQQSLTFNGTIGTVTGTMVGGKLFISRRGAVESRYMDGDIAEIVGCDAALSTVDHDAVVSYLNSKWAIY